MTDAINIAVPIKIEPDTRMEYKARKKHQCLFCPEEIPSGSYCYWVYELYDNTKIKRFSHLHHDINEFRV